MKNKIQKDIFMLFSSCIPVKGASRSIIYDISRNDFLFLEEEDFLCIKNQIIDICEDNKELIEFLFESNYGFFTKTPELFPEISFNYSNEKKITNAIIDIYNTYSHLDSLLSKAEILGLEALEIRFFGDNESLLSKILDLVSNSYISSLTLCINNYNVINTDISIDNYVEKLLTHYKEIILISFFNCYEKNITTVNDIPIILNKSSLDNKNCGNISPDFFNINIDTFTETKHCNFCLNKKIAIDSTGLISPCPSIKDYIGNIETIKTEELFNNEQLEKYNIPKDQINICKDCEFRYMCHDCRAFTERTHTNSEGLDFSKPLKCGYDPYSGVWKEWSTNPLKQKAINFYEIQDLIKNEN